MYSSLVDVLLNTPLLVNTILCVTNNMFVNVVLSYERFWAQGKGFKFSDPLCEGRELFTKRRLCQRVGAHHT